MNHAPANDNNLAQALDLIGGFNGFLITFRGHVVAKAGTLSIAARLLTEIKQAMGWSK